MEDMIYDADYYERGIETGKSNYQNYRWIPELTIPMAMTIIDFLEILPHQSILDYGCAKGYLVKALRMLHRNAWGFDISEYATNSADKDTRHYLTNNFPLPGFTYFDFVICKDVFEHIPVEELKKILVTINATELFTIVPLGNNGKYFASANDRDITHIICQPKEWWLNLFEECGWTCVKQFGKLTGIKDSYPEDSHFFMVHTR
jgi:SAM-dependent methyltransferase